MPYRAARTTIDALVTPRSRSANRRSTSSALEIRRPEYGHVVRPVGEFLYRNMGGVRADPSPQEVVQLGDDQRRDDRICRIRQHSECIAVNGVRGIEGSEQAAGVADHCSPKPSARISSTRLERSEVPGPIPLASRAPRGVGRSDATAFRRVSR